jgi:UDP-N-acetylglucosamine 2-epimerase (non-hydrolysing)
MRVLLVVGTRPNLVKASALLPAFRAAGIETFVLHTGQHSDYEMRGALMADLGLPPPDFELTCVGDNPTERLCGMISGIGRLLAAGPPFDWVCVVGDCDNSLAGALAARKAGVKLAHVEAGLRSADAVQENLNRVLVDHASDLLFASEFTGLSNLAREGVAGEACCPGNVMVDALKRLLPTIESRTPYFANAPKYAVLTLHRAENVDDPERYKECIMAAAPVADRMPVVFPMHPRTRRAFDTFRHVFCVPPRIDVIPPLGYIDFVKLEKEATLVLTDSGGIQEETTAMQIPCLTLRESTERPSTFMHGTNEVVGFDAEKVSRCVDRILAGKWKSGHGPSNWDGHAADRIAKVMAAQCR